MIEKSGTTMKIQKERRKEEQGPSTPREGEATVCKSPVERQTRAPPIGTTAVRTPARLAWRASPPHRLEAPCASLPRRQSSQGCPGDAARNARTRRSGRRVSDTGRLFWVASALRAPTPAPPAARGQTRLQPGHGGPCGILSRSEERTQLYINPGHNAYPEQRERRERPRR